MLTLLLIACVPADMLGAPLPESYDPVATHYRTETQAPEQQAPLERWASEVLAEKAAAGGATLRVDAALTEVARMMAFRMAVDAESTSVVEARQLALALGAPLPPTTVAVFADRRGRSELEGYSTAALEQSGGKVAVGIGAWDAKKALRGTLALVFATDALSLDAPVPIAGPRQVSGTWQGRGRLLAFATPLVGPEELAAEAGAFSFALPEGATRLDLVAERSLGTPLAWMDFKGAAPLPELPAGSDPAARTLAGFNALRAEAGVEPLSAVSGNTGCGGWPTVVEGKPVTQYQRCAVTAGVEDVEQWWELYAPRPTTQRAALEPRFAWFASQAGTDWHLYEPFELLEPEAGEARAAAFLQRLWPDAELDQTSVNHLRAAAAMGASSSADGMQRGLAQLRDITEPFDTPRSGLRFNLSTAETFSELEAGFADAGACTRFGVGFAQGADAEGRWHHVLALYCEPI